jgi:NADH-quinone oxidoreductase subunit M
MHIQRRLQLGSVIYLQGAFKDGTYGFLRFAITTFPKAAFDAIPLISVLAIIGIIYGAPLSA